MKSPTNTSDRFYLIYFQMLMVFSYGLWSWICKILTTVKLKLTKIFIINTHWLDRRNCLIENNAERKEQAHVMDPIIIYFSHVSCFLLNWMWFKIWNICEINSSNFGFAKHQSNDFIIAVMNAKCTFINSNFLR